MRVRRLVSVAMAAVAFPFCLRADTVLLSDSFDVTQSSTDINFQLASRQAGTLAPISYNQSQDDADYHHELRASDGKLRLAADQFGYGRVALDHNFNQIGTEVIAFDVAPLTSDTDARVVGTAWAGITFGQSASDALKFVTQSGGFGLLYRGNGDCEAWSAGTNLGNVPYASAPAGPHHITITIDAADGKPFSGAPVNIMAYVDQNPRPVFEFTRTLGFTDDFIGLQVTSDPGPIHPFYYATHEFDNLRISIIPEPSNPWVGIVLAAAIVACRRRAVAGGASS